jgi:hypothetical protein
MHRIILALTCAVALLAGSVQSAQGLEPEAIFADGDHPAKPAGGIYDGPTDKLHVYLLIGQSNMAGRAPFTSEESGPIARSYLLDANDRWVPASNPLNRFSTIRKGLDMQKMNPGYGFAQTLLERDEGLAVGLVVNARGGTEIELWAKGTDFYNEALRRTRIALETGALKGILWHQGESNSRNPDGYFDQLTDLVKNLRRDLGMPHLPFIAGQVFYDAETKPHTEQINQQIAKLPQSLAHTGYVSSDGLTTHDNTHFDAASMKRLGNRYAEQMLNVQNQPMDELP